MTVAITVDLDDTIIMTQRDFEDAREWFADYVSDTYDVEFEEAKSTQSEMSKELLDKYGLSIERFPNACVRALETLVDNPSQEDINRVFEIGRSAFKEDYQYEERGFRDGCLDLIYLCQDLSDKLVLLTSGDERLQNRKIEALNLREMFDEVRIVEMGRKSSYLSELRESFDRVIHIGNSESSDVNAAVDAGVHCVYVPEGEWRDQGSDVSKQTNVVVADNMAESMGHMFPLMES